MSKLSIMTILWFGAGLLWLVAFAVLDSGARWLALFCAVMFLTVGFRRLSLERQKK